MWQLVVNYGGRSYVDPNHPWNLPQSRDYIGPNPRVAGGNKLGVRPRPNPKKKSVNERRTGG
jgi:hypothetical protein